VSAKLARAHFARPDQSLPFSGFLDFLKRRGFAVDVDRHLRLVSLLEKIGGECEPHELKQLVAPLFATNKREQAHFYRVFDEYFHLLLPSDRREKRGEGAAVRSAKITEEKTNRLRRSLAWGAGFITFAAVAGVAALMFTKFESRTGSPTPALLWIGGLLLLALFAGNELRRFFKNRQLVLERTRGLKPPFTWPIRIEPRGLRYLNSEQFYKVARKLQRRQIAEYHRLDIPRTIDATIAASGYPTFQYRPDSRMPEYLILIDRTSARDHQAALFEQLALALQREGVFVRGYFFDGDPRVCWSERKSDQ
jgi:hypothetical protein